MSKVAKILGVFIISAIMLFSIVRNVNAVEDTEIDKKVYTIENESEEKSVYTIGAEKDDEKVYTIGAEQEDEKVYTIGVKSAEKAPANSSNKATTIYIILCLGVCIIAITSTILVMHKKQEC